MHCSIFVSKFLALSAEACSLHKPLELVPTLISFLAEVEVADPSPRPHSRPESLSGDYFHQCSLLMYLSLGRF